MQSISVLVVDANQQFLRSIVRYLAEIQPGQIEVVGTALCRPDALALASALRPQVVLVGLSQPVGDALTLIAELRQIGVEQVVAMGQLGSAGYAQAALAAGAAMFVEKDRLQDELVMALMHNATRQLREHGI